MKPKKTTAAILAVFAAIAGYADHNHGKTACAHNHDHQSEHGHQNGSHAKVHVPLSVQKVMGLKTVHAQKRLVSSSVSFAGRYELVPDARTVVSSPVAGRLSLLVKTLSNVREGDALFKVTSPELIARSHEISALEKRLKVYREIKTPNAALENELAVKRAEREAMLAGAHEHNGTVTVHASSDGMVESLFAQDGSWLETGAAAIQIVRAHHLRFKALLAASDALLLKDGMSAKVGMHTGRIRIGVGDDTGLVPVYVLFDSDVNALAAERAIAQCSTQSNEKPHLSIPSKCIVTVNLQPTVFVRDAHDHEHFIAVAVTPLASNDGWSAIEGLDSTHCEIVSDGAYELKIALQNSDSKKTAGHYHADGTFHTGEH